MYVPLPGFSSDEFKVWRHWTYHGEFATDTVEAYFIGRYLGDAKSQMLGWGPRLRGLMSGGEKLRGRYGKRARYASLKPTSVPEVARVVLNTDALL